MLIRPLRIGGIGLLGVPVFLHPQFDESVLRSKTECFVNEIQLHNRNTYHSHSGISTVPEVTNSSPNLSEVRVGLM